MWHFLYNLKKKNNVNKYKKKKTKLMECEDDICDTNISNTHDVLFWSLFPPFIEPFSSLSSLEPQRIFEEKRCIVATYVAPNIHINIAVPNP
ncbi:Protein of unknown function [Gryllus bimaculatus]|nr:Protein of unknown function [Gryllus bimaculatus]